MGLVGFFGVIAAGAWSDRSGPMWPALASFILRIGAFALVMVDQSPLSITVTSQTAWPAACHSRACSNTCRSRLSIAAPGHGPSAVTALTQR